MTQLLNFLCFSYSFFHTGRCIIPVFQLKNLQLTGVKLAGPRKQAGGGARIQISGLLAPKFFTYFILPPKCAFQFPLLQPFINSNQFFISSLLELSYSTLSVYSPLLFIPTHASLSDHIISFEKSLMAPHFLQVKH